MFNWKRLFICFKKNNYHNYHNYDDDESCTDFNLD